MERMIRISLKRHNSGAPREAPRPAGFHGRVPASRKTRRSSIPSDHARQAKLHFGTNRTALETLTVTEAPRKPCRPGRHRHPGQGRRTGADQQRRTPLLGLSGGNARWERRGGGETARSPEELVVAMVAKCSAVHSAPFTTAKTRGLDAIECFSAFP